MKSKTADFVFIVLLLVFNFVLVKGFFGGVYTAHVSSIESQYFSHIKFIVENFPRIWWQPFWYAGFPFMLFYQPILPFSLSLVRAVSGLPISLIYRFSVGTFYILGSVSVYFLFRDLTKKNAASFVAALVYSVGPSVTALVPVIANQEKTLNLVPWRLVVLAIYGEGGHIWGLTIVPIGLLFFRKLLLKQSRTNWILAVGVSVLVLLTSITAFMPYLVLILIFWLAELYSNNFAKKLLTLIFLLLFTYLLGAFWYNLSFLQVLFGFAELGAGGIFNGIWGNPFVLIFILIPAFAVFSFVIGPKLGKSEEARLWLVAVLGFAAFYLAVYLRYCCTIAFLPLPLDYLPRLGPEVELVFALFLTVTLAYLEKNAQKLFSKGVIYIKAAFYIVLVAFLSFSFVPRLKIAKELTASNPDIYQTSEYKVAKWLGENSDGSRIYATGTHGQWLDFWVNVPQLRGAADQAIVNPLWPHVIYQIYWGDNGNLAVDWLKALGIKYIVVNTAGSKVAYKDYRYPGKFKEQAKLVYEFEGDEVYLLPTKKTKLVYEVNADKLNLIGRVKSVLDKERLEKYLALTDDNNDFKQVDYSYGKPWDTLSINGESISGTRALLVRINYYRGWYAVQGSKRIKLESDPLGFMIIYPENNKDIKLKFGLPLNVKVGYLISAIGAVAFILFLKRKVRARENK